MGRQPVEIHDGAERQAPVRRGIVVVHGVGQQRRGDQLDHVAESLTAFLQRALGPASAHLTARTHLDAGEIASATIHIRRPNHAEPDEEWEIREAWWAESFRPSTAAMATQWAVRALLYQSVAHVRFAILALGRGSGLGAGRRRRRRDA